LTSPDQMVGGLNRQSQGLARFAMCQLSRQLRAEHCHRLLTCPFAALEAAHTIGNHEQVARRSAAVVPEAADLACKDVVLVDLANAANVGAGAILRLHIQGVQNGSAATLDSWNWIWPGNRFSGNLDCVRARPSQYVATDASEQLGYQRNSDIHAVRQQRARRHPGDRRWRGPAARPYSRGNLRRAQPDSTILAPVGNERDLVHRHTDDAASSDVDA